MWLIHLKAAEEYLQSALESDLPIYVQLVLLTTCDWTVIYHFTIIKYIHWIHWPEPLELFCSFTRSSTWFNSNSVLMGEAADLSVIIFDFFFLAWVLFLRINLLFSPTNSSFTISFLKALVFERSEFSLTTAKLHFLFRLLPGAPKISGYLGEENILISSEGLIDGVIVLCSSMMVSRGLLRISWSPVSGSLSTRRHSSTGWLIGVSLLSCTDEANDCFLLFITLRMFLNSISGSVALSSC